MEEPRLWYVTLTVGGRAHDPDELRAALERLSHERPFLLDGSYAPSWVELSYWEEADVCEDACALALRLWGEHRASAGLPAWSVLGLEVVDRDVLGRRVGPEPSPVSATTRWRLHGGY